VRVLEKLIPNQSVLALTARTWALQNCMSLIPKDETSPASGAMMKLITPGSLFILNNMAERVGFVYCGICYLSPSQAHRQELTVLQ
jgi:hypothetical protein